MLTIKFLMEDGSEASFFCRVQSNNMLDAFVEALSYVEHSVQFIRAIWREI